MYLSTHVKMMILATIVMQHLEPNYFDKHFHMRNIFIWIIYIGGIYGKKTSFVAGAQKKT